VIYFETHATSLDNEAGLASGHFDVDLSASGERQAVELGTRYAGVSLDVVLCSDLRRSYRTAEIAFAGRGIPIVRDARLRECSYGDLDRAPVEAIERERPKRVAVPFPSGQSYSQVLADVQNCLRDHATAGNILIVGHRATWYALECLFNKRRLTDVISDRWRWHPGWKYSR
jgi:broad specificity phosphatase PhoE